MSELPTSPKLRTLLFRNRQVLRQLEAEGISRRELRDAVRTLRAAAEFPDDESSEMLAVLIAAELADIAGQKAQSINWDKIIELINQLMPLILAWIEMCGV